MVKVIFFGFRKQGLTRDEAIAEAGAEPHASFMKEAAGPSTLGGESPDRQGATIWPGLDQRAVLR